MILLVLSLSVVQLAYTQKTASIRILALGDSYTIGERVLPEERWPVQLAEAIQEKGIPVEEVKIIARTGWRTDQLAQAIQEDSLTPPYDLVTLLIGVNNQYQGLSSDDYEEVMPELVETAIELAGGKASRVLVLSIPDYAYTPFGQGKRPEKISRELRAFNRINRIVAKRYKTQYVDITPISKQGLNQPVLVAEDGLHPSGEQYHRWVLEILDEVDLNRLFESR